MSFDPVAAGAIPTTISPWLSVRGGARAVEFYKAGFGAKEVFRLEAPDGAVVARLSMDGAEFWLSDESPENGNVSPEAVKGTPVRMVVIVTDPDAAFGRAIEAGAKEVCAMKNDHGWRVGRVVDPFGHHWEFGRKIGGQAEK
ncbi:MAG: VOC family protein [Candidatus Acidiferrum sp.]